MKLNKTFGRIATTLVATAMLASVAVVPAFAAEAIQDNGTAIGTGLTEVSFTKVYRMPLNVKVPAVNFSFSGVGTVEGADESKTSDGTTISVKAGLGTVSGNLASTAFPAVPTRTDATTATYEATVTLSLPTEQLTDPGVYAYKLTESKEGANANDVELGSPRFLYVFVENNTTTEEDLDDVVITGVELDTADGTGKTNKWVNYYKLSGDPDVDDPDVPPAVEANELTVVNILDGDMANMSDTFTYTVASTTSTADWTAYIEDANGDTSPVEITTLSTTGIELGHNEKLHIYGLSSGNNYTVTAVDADANNYNTVQTDDSANGTFGSEDLTVTYTNTRDAVSPTGLVMDIAPYALLVIVAAAGCFVFLRKRRED